MIREVWVTTGLGGPCDSDRVPENHFTLEGTPEKLGLEPPAFCDTFLTLVSIATKVDNTFLAYLIGLL